MFKGILFAKCACSLTEKVANGGWYSGKPEGSTLKEDICLLKIALCLQQITGTTTEIQIVQSILWWL